MQLWQQPFDSDAESIDIPRDHPDLIVDPTGADIDLAAAFERGEISAYEYPDGHTYPPNREIPTKSRRSNEDGRIH